MSGSRYVLSKPEGQPFHEVCDTSVPWHGRPGEPVARAAPALSRRIRDWLNSREAKPTVTTHQNRNASDPAAAERWCRVIDGPDGHQLCARLADDDDEDSETPHQLICEVRVGGGTIAWAFGFRRGSEAREALEHAHEQAEKLISDARCIAAKMFVQRKAVRK